MQPSLPGLQAPREEHFLPCGGFVRVWPQRVPDHERHLAQLVSELPLRAENLVLFGKEVQTPRETSFHGDPHCRYRYSGRTFSPNPWTPALQQLRQAVEDTCGTRFNTVLVNHYRNGQDAMGAHSDDEPELGPTRQDIRIASLSLGSRRRFLLSPKDRSHDALRFSLGEGDLLLMGGTTQTHYRHSVTRTRAPVDARLNLTFRVVRPSAYL